MSQKGNDVKNRQRNYAFAPSGVGKPKIRGF
jgi:hypothetical protein